VYGACVRRFEVGGSFGIAAGAVVVGLAALSAALLAPAARAADALGGVGPDILGLQTGMTPDQVYNKLKEIDPTHRVTVGQVLIPPLGKQAVVYGMSPEALSGGADVVTVQMSMPPNPQQVWTVYRQMSGKIHTTIGQLLDSLHQKYGQESHRQGAENNPDLIWVYDQQGRLADAGTAAKVLHDCGNAFNPVSIGQLPPPFSPPQAGVFPPPIVNPFTLSQYQDPTKNVACQGWVLVHGVIAGDLQNGYNLTLSITNALIQKRAALALSNVLNGVANNQAQQQLQRAREQSVPKL
jgi:hypothetical protein